MQSGSSEDFTSANLLALAGRHNVSFEKVFLLGGRQWHEERPENCRELSQAESYRSSKDFTSANLMALAGR